MMFGKHFASTYTGSMVGAGWAVFAVMGYVIANMRPDSVVGAQVELNPTIMAAVFGEDESEVVDAITFLCKPDPKTRTPDEDGRRLVKLGSFDYRVVNGAKYLAIRDEAERREANRIRQAEHRAKAKKKSVTNGTPSPGEAGYVAAVESGGEASGNAHLEKLDKLRSVAAPALQPFVEHLNCESVKFGDALIRAAVREKRDEWTEPVVPVPGAFDEARHTPLGPISTPEKLVFTEIPVVASEPEKDPVKPVKPVVAIADGMPDDIPGLLMVKREKEANAAQIHKAFCEIAPDGKESWLSSAELARWRKMMSYIRELNGKVERLKGSQ